MYDVQFMTSYIAWRCAGICNVAKETYIHQKRRTKGGYLRRLYDVQWMTSYIAWRYAGICNVAKEIYMYQKTHTKEGYLRRF